MKELIEYFFIEYGDHTLNSKWNLDKGKTLVISSQGLDNGCYGFYDVPVNHDEYVISVPRTGSIGYAFVQNNQCSIDDNCLVLTPKNKYPIEYLFYITNLIRLDKWRYRYGRQITPHRLGKMKVKSPQEFKTIISYGKLLKELYPKKNQKEKKLLKPNSFKSINIATIFNIERGDFHAIDRLKQGKIPTISRISTDNGLVGFYKKPSNAELYKKGIITISTVTGDAFLQLNPFIATDNVLILNPKKDYLLTTLFYIVTVLNSYKWKYSYGRQPYKRIFEKTDIILPIDKNNNLNENYMKSIIENNEYWEYLNKNL